MDHFLETSDLGDAFSEEGKVCPPITKKQYIQTKSI